MLCSECGKNEATVYYKQNINGVIKEFSLCNSCAKKYKAKIFPDNFGFNIISGLYDNMSPYTGLKEKKVCTLCGSTFDDIVHNGKVGCTKCYEIFKNELSGTIKSIHGDVHHIGRGPKEFAKKNEAKNKLNSLKNQLNKAIANEEYEKAAELRDQIRALEEEG